MTESEIKVKVAVSIMEKQDAEIQSLRKQRAELLEALKEILQEYEGGGYCADQELINKANSAITKAEATE